MMPVRLAPKKKNKYNAKKAVVDGITFDSVAESTRYGKLALMQRAGLIADLVTHPEFRIEMNGTPICRVVLDFSYKNIKTGKTIYEDLKGKDNALSKLKRKLVSAVHLIDVEIIKK